MNSTHVTTDYFLHSDSHGQVHEFPLLKQVWLAGDSAAVPQQRPNDNIYTRKCHLISTQTPDIWYIWYIALYLTHISPN